MLSRNGYNGLIDSTCIVDQQVFSSQVCELLPQELRVTLAGYSNDGRVQSNAAEHYVQSAK